MKYRLMKFPLIHLLLLYLFFCEKKCIYSKSIQYVYNFYVTDPNLCIYGGASLQKSQKSFIVDAPLGSK